MLKWAILGVLGEFCTGIARWGVSGESFVPGGPAKAACVESFVPGLAKAASGVWKLEVCAAGQACLSRRHNKTARRVAGRWWTKGALSRF